MRKITIAVGLAVAVCMLGIGAASALAIEYPTFEASGGTVTKGVSVSKLEEFKVWPMTITCTKAVTKGTVPSEPTFQSFTDEVTYSSCTTFGTLKVTVSPGFWEYRANDTVALLEPITIKPSLLACHYEIPAQSEAFSKESVFYSDNLSFKNTKKFPKGQKTLQVHATLKGMEYTAFGWPCTGPKNAEEKKEGKELEETGNEGQFVGAVEEEIGTGALTWTKEEA
jgi:hypothetical protein